jgi:hypothetical protein
VILDLGNAALLLGMGYLATRPPMPAARSRTDATTSSPALAHPHEAEKWRGRQRSCRTPAGSSPRIVAAVNRLVSGKIALLGVCHQTG